MKKRFELRNVVGKHYLVCTSQSKVAYEPPIELNDVGAEIYERHQQKMTDSEIAYFLSNKYGISHELAMTDVKDFMKQMESIWTSY